MSEIDGRPAEWERGEFEATTVYLARQLTMAGAPAWMVTLAQDGHYDDYQSPLATPAIQLLADLRAAGLDVMAERHMAGEFDATKAESDAWAASPEGQATFAELVQGSKNRAQRRADKKRRRGGR